MCSVKISFSTEFWSSNMLSGKKADLYSIIRQWPQCLSPLQPRAFREDAPLGGVHLTVSAASYRLKGGYSYRHQRSFITVFGWARVVGTHGGYVGNLMPPCAPRHALSPKLGGQCEIDWQIGRNQNL